MARENAFTSVNGASGGEARALQREWLWAGIALTFLLAFPASSTADCASGIGCKACVQDLGSLQISCATVKRDGFCSCAPITNGCTLAGICDYTGASEECETTPEGGECPFIKRSAGKRAPQRLEAPKVVKPQPTLASRGDRVQAQRRQPAASRED